MLRTVKRTIPQALINYIKHLPEAVLANLRYGFPAKRLKIVGVTGTDGKTTTVNMVYKILKDAGKKVSMISTIHATVAGKTYETGFHVTSPGPFYLQRFLKMAADYGDEFFVIEVTSHALDQFRVWGVPFEIGVITNVTHEHLDYHKTFENYLKSKAKLIKNAKWAVLNYDDESFEKLKKMTQATIISFGLSKKADLNSKNYSLKLKLPGKYNLENALAAAAVCQILNIDKAIIKKSLEGISYLNGRMEKVSNRRGITIVIDFAHTPNALKKVLSTLKKQTRRKLIAVLGCASERDIAKRPLMGKIASGLADITILTNEDPRFESPIKIINEIAEGGSFVEGKNLFKEPNRSKAIKLALNLAKKTDLVGIFGKGHETSMNYKGVERPWSDKKAVLYALKNGRKN